MTKQVDATDYRSEIQYFPVKEEENGVFRMETFVVPRQKFSIDRNKMSLSMDFIANSGAVVTADDSLFIDDFLNIKADLIGQFREAVTRQVLADKLREGKLPLELKQYDPKMNYGTEQTDGYLRTQGNVRTMDISEAAAKMYAELLHIDLK